MPGADLSEGFKGTVRAGTGPRGRGAGGVAGGACFSRRPVGKACPLLLAVVGREPSDAAPVRKHAAADSGFAAAGRIGAAARRNQSGRRRGLEGGCLRNRFEIRQITAFWPGQRTRGAVRGLCRWNECEKGGEPGTLGCILSSPDKQNGNPGLLPYLTRGPSIG